MRARERGELAGARARSAGEGVAGAILVERAGESCGGGGDDDRDGDGEGRGSGDGSGTTAVPPSSVGAPLGRGSGTAEERAPAGAGGVGCRGRALPSSRRGGELGDAGTGGSRVVPAAAGSKPAAAAASAGARETVRRCAVGISDGGGVGSGDGGGGVGSPSVKLSGGAAVTTVVAGGDMAALRGGPGVTVESTAVENFSEGGTVPVTRGAQRSEGDVGRRGESHRDKVDSEGGTPFTDEIPGKGAGAGVSAASASPTAAASLGVPLPLFAVWGGGGVCKADPLQRSVEASGTYGGAIGVGTMMRLVLEARCRRGVSAATMDPKMPRCGLPGGLPMSSPSPPPPFPPAVAALGGRP